MGDGGTQGPGETAVQGCGGSQGAAIGVGPGAPGAAAQSRGDGAGTLPRRPVSVRLFAAAAEALGGSHIVIQLTEGATAADCLAELARRGGPLLHTCTVAVNRVTVAPDQVLDPLAEVAILPPVSGGAGRLLGRSRPGGERRGCG